MTTLEIMKRARAASPALACADTETKNRALCSMAGALKKYEKEILEANRFDMEQAPKTISAVMADRLRLTEERIQAMSDGISDVAKLKDPVGEILERVERPNGLIIEKTAAHIGVIAIIYESRPNVTSDAAALAVKSGNACILRAGKEAHRSALAITGALRDGLREAGLPEDGISLIEDTNRESAVQLMEGVGYVDLLIPRGGAGLIKTCMEKAKVPCIQTGTGICHMYVDEKADLNMALSIVENGKTSRPSVCNAAEVLLVHSWIAGEFLPQLRKRLCLERKENPVELRLDRRSAEIIEGTAAGEKDFDTEFLDYILAVKIVDSLEEAIEHIRLHSTGHSEAIITDIPAHGEQFARRIDSAAVYINASTRFTDGGEFGLGCEMGISTQKLHARGPMGLKELTTYKYIVRGTGQIR